MSDGFVLSFVNPSAPFAWFAHREDLELCLSTWGGKSPVIQIGKRRVLFGAEGTPGTLVSSDGDPIAWMARDTMPSTLDQVVLRLPGATSGLSHVSVD